MIVYAGEDEEYFTFISSEAWQELKKWIEYRQSSGETISESSWVMRDLWDTRVAQGRGFAISGSIFIVIVSKTSYFIYGN
jgi:hypothetical protein